MNNELLYQHIDDWRKLDSDLQEVILAALDARKNAYAPYSGFNVGAALRLDSGKIIRGSNHENAAYPLCMCGERVALYAAFASHPTNKILTLAICAQGQKPIIEPAAPCGACRQVICEFEDKQDKKIKIVLVSNDFTCRIFDSGKVLLPFSFDKDQLL